MFSGNQKLRISLTWRLASWLRQVSTSTPLLSSILVSGTPWDRKYTGGRDNWYQLVIASGRANVSCLRVFVHPMQWYFAVAMGEDAKRKRGHVHDRREISSILKCKALPKICKKTWDAKAFQGWHCSVWLNTTKGCLSSTAYSSLAWRFQDDFGEEGGVKRIIQSAEYCQHSSPPIQSDPDHGGIQMSTHKIALFVGQRDAQLSKYTVHSLIARLFFFFSS